MKAKSVIRSLTIAILLLLSAAFAVYAETVRIVTKENALREDCRFFSPVKLKLRYGDQLEIISKEGDWLRAAHKATKGCIHKTAVTERSVSLPDISGADSHAASSDEVALAGKGFNPQVEESFKNKHPELDYKTVDMIEGYKTSDDNLLRFIKNGELNQP